MDSLIQKLQAVRLEIAAEFGRLDFFALFQRADTEKWDVLVAASWFENETAGLRLIAKKLQDRLTTGELLQLARVVVLDDSSRSYRQFVETHQAEGTVIQLHNETIFGQDVRNAYVLASGSFV